MAGLSRTVSIPKEEDRKYQPQYTWYFKWVLLMAGTSLTCSILKAYIRSTPGWKRMDRWSWRNIAERSDDVPIHKRGRPANSRSLEASRNYSRGEIKPFMDTYIEKLPRLLERRDWEKVIIGLHPRRRMTAGMSTYDWNVTYWFVQTAPKMLESGSW